jgi:hypothetical protein
MNNINAELLQMKIDGHCLYYPSNFEFSDLITHSKWVCDCMTDYGSILIDLNDEKYTLFCATKQVLHLLIDYFERILQDDISYEESLATICLHFQCELIQYMSETEEDEEITEFLFQGVELLGLIFRILGSPMSKKTFENSY